MKDERMKKRKRVQKKLDFYHVYFKKNGMYGFLYRNIFKLLLGLASIFVLIYLAKAFLPDLDETMDIFFQKLNKFWVLAVFYVSESLLGLIPPDLFIAWSSSMKKPFQMVCLLGLLSYFGGITSYYIGKGLGKIPRVEQYVLKRFVRHFETVKKWGGFMIVFAAIFPLPYSPICIAAGIIRYPFFPFLLLGLTRFIRFFVYALLIFKALGA